MVNAALVIGNYRATLVVIRSLSAAGYKVVLGTNGNTHGNERSRFTAECWPHPELEAPENAFGGALQALLERRADIRLVVPVTEEAVVHFARHAYPLPEGVTVAAAVPELVEVCQSKEKSLELAVAAGVPCAPYAIVDSLSSLKSSASSIGYPCIVRPLVAPVRVFGRKALIVESSQDLDATIPDWPSEHRRLMVQQYLRAPRHNVYFAARRGEIAGCVQVLILRTDRSDGTGLAVEGITLPLDARLHDYCRALVRDLDYTGVGCAQFLVEPNSGRVSFIEINPRLGANCAIVQHCGVDLPLSMCLLAQGESLEALKLPPDYPAGRRYAWLFGDLAGLQHEIASRRLGLGRTLAWLGRLSWNAIRADVHLTFSWRDPMPTLTLFARRLFRRRARFAAPAGEAGSATSHPAKAD